VQGLPLGRRPGSGPEQCLPGHGRNEGES
jgi:hypothetical protein